MQLAVPPKKKIKALEELQVPSIPSLDVSFCDDEALPPGIIFTDINQKKWRLGKPVGRGSFGRIYLASDEIDKEVLKVNAQYVVKIEPHTNGPLFVEIHCLKRTAKAEKLKEWRRENKQKRLGMPVYIASGSFTDETSGTKYRFLVLPRYDVDLHKIISLTKVLDVKHVLILAIQILDVLEYLHNEGYTHSDIKSSNLMLGYDRKVPVVKLSPPFQKDLSVKHRKSKPGKSRPSNYYIDEDFIIKDYKSPTSSEDENEKRLANVKKKLRKILTDKDSRNAHRHHAFNLRQLSNYANYEDLNSSVCSDQSYQKLIDDFGHKNVIQTTKQFQQSVKNAQTSSDDIYKEAIASQSAGQIYLLDYGLASKFLDSEGNHKDFGMDARKAHDGTLEYSSRDSHIGAHSRRSDLETLGYNLLEWLTGTLPWKTPEVLAEPDLVHALKKNYMSDIKLLLKTCFKTEFYPPFMEKYLQYITGLDFKEKPDYDYCRSLFQSELLKNGNKVMTLNFMEVLKPNANRSKQHHANRFGRKNTPPNFVALNGIRKACERENVFSLENDLKLELLRQTLNNSSDGVRKPCASRNFFVSDADLVARLKKSLIPHGVFGKKLSPKNLRSKQKTVKKRRGVRKHRNSIGKFGNFMGSARQFSWAEILAQNPEHIIRKERNATTDEDDDDTCKYRIRKLSNASSECSESSMQSPLLQKDYLKDLNPTDAMKEVINLLKNKVSRKQTKEFEKTTENFPGYTPAMIKVHKMKEKREAKEKLEAMKLNSPKKEVQTKRCTRSMKTGVAKKVPEPSTRVTRKKASMDSVNTNESITSNKSSDKSKSKTKKIGIEKEVKFVEEPKPAQTPQKPQKKSKRSSRKSVYLPNRRCLRSSRRIK